MLPQPITYVEIPAPNIAQASAFYRGVFGSPSTCRHKQFLIRRIAWGVQAGGTGCLSQRARRRAAELVDPRDLRVRTATNLLGQAPKPERSPIPGTVICRKYKGEVLEVRVLKKGFEFRGQTFGSLSAVAKHVTGSHWNGNVFFGVRSKRQRSKQQP